MSKAGGIKYLLKHGKAPDPVTTRTRMPAMKTKKMARGGLSAVSPYDLLTPEQLALLPNEYRDAIAGHPDTGGKAYFYDPKSQRYTLANPVKTATSGQVTANPLDYLSGRGGGGGSSAAEPSAWDKMSGAEKAAYYNDNPGMGAFTRAGQDLWDKTILGKVTGWLQDKFDPGFREAMRAQTYGLDRPNFESIVREMGVNGSNMNVPSVNEGMTEAEQRAAYSQGRYMAPTGYGPDGMGPPSSAAGDGAAAARAAAETQASIDSRTSEADANAARSAGGNYGYAKGGIAALAAGGRSGSLGAYSDGGQLLRGPGDGVSDSIPAKIGKNQPARLADGEFVIPARIVSELGNGSTEAGSRKLYAMMERIQKGRKKTMGGKGAYAKDTKAAKHLPA